MDRLALHIEYLLLRHDCVVVPGCGAFINVCHSALEDTDNGVMNPMTCEARFNPALSHDDGMLATSYARRERVSFAEGREMVRASISNLRDALALDGEVTIGRLGQLRMDSEQNISFHPITTPERAAAAMGFSAVRTGIKATVVQGAVQEGRLVDVEKTPVHRFDTTRNYYIPINKMFARMAASFLIVMIVALAAILPFGRNLNEDQASVIPVKAITQAVTNAATPETPSETVAVPEPAPASEPASSVPNTPSAVLATVPTAWHIIVGAFYNQKDADTFIRMNSDKGYTLTTLVSGNLYMISACSATDKNPLLKELKASTLRQSFPEAWIFNSRN